MNEVAIFKKMLMNQTVSIFLLWAAPAAVSVVTIGVYNYYNTNLDISVILVCLTIFNLLQMPLRQLPLSVATIMEIVVSMKRIEVYITIK